MAPIVRVMASVPLAGEKQLPGLSEPSRQFHRASPGATHLSAPLGRIRAVANVGFDLEAPAEKREHFDHADAGVDGVACERTWYRPARVAGLETETCDLLDLDRLSEDQG